MRAITTDGGKPGSVWRRLGWFVCLWCASLAFFALLAYGLRAVIGVGG